MDSSSDESCREERRFYCNIDNCTESFSKRRKLLNHIRLHRGERPFVCDAEGCGKSYTNSSHLLRHKKTKHTAGDKKIPCPEEGCSRELVVSSLKKHIYRCHTRLYPFTCRECQKGFHRKNDLRRHTFLHTGNLPYSCGECDAKFITTKEKSKHEKKHKKYTCECGDVLEKWSNYLDHKKNCKLQACSCSMCEKKFSNGVNLKKHLATHVNPDERKLFFCPYTDCDRYYLYKKNLTDHISCFHKKTVKPKIACTYEGCSKTFSKMNSYKYHMQSHGETIKPKFPRKPRKDKGEPKKEFLNKLIPFTA